MSTLFQTCVDLATWSNAKLAGRDVGTELEESLLWARFLIEDGWNVFALGLDKWAQIQKRDGAQYARIYMAPGGERNHHPSTVPDMSIWWAATTVYQDKEYLWIPNLVPATEDDPERMMVRRYELRPDAPKLTAGIAEAEENLRSELDKAIGFANDYKLDYLVRRFQAGLESLDKYNPEDQFLKRLPALTLYPVKSRQLVAAAIHAWPFWSGMASWYDLGAAMKDPRYHDLTSSYYRAMAQAVVAACDVKL